MKIRVYPRKMIRSVKMVNSCREMNDDSDERMDMDIFSGKNLNAIEQ